MCFSIDSWKNRNHLKTWLPIHWCPFLLHSQGWMPCKQQSDIPTVYQTHVFAKLQKQINCDLQWWVSGSRANGAKWGCDAIGNKVVKGGSKLACATLHDKLARDPAHAVPLFFSLARMSTSSATLHGGAELLWSISSCTKLDPNKTLMASLHKRSSTQKTLIAARISGSLLNNDGANSTILSLTLARKGRISTEACMQMVCFCCCLASSAFVSTFSPQCC